MSIRKLAEDLGPEVTAPVGSTPSVDAFRRRGRRRRSTPSGDGVDPAMPVVPTPPVVPKLGGGELPVVPPRGDALDVEPSTLVVPRQA